jgi:serine phosphatase RsbU (regulator of sigma subunit)
MIVTLIVALIYLDIGLFVFLRRPNDARAVIFFIMTLCAALAFMSTSLLQIEGGSTRGIVMMHRPVNDLARPIAAFGATIFFAPLLLHLALIFPKERPVVARGRILWTWIYGFPVILLSFTIVCSIFFTILGRLPPGREKALGPPLIKSFGILVCIAALIALVRIILSMNKHGMREGALQRPLASMTLAASLLIGFAGVTTWIGARFHSSAAGVAALLAMGAVGVAGFSVYPIATFIALYRSYRDSGIEERRQVKWPLWGTMIAVSGKLVLTLIGTAIGFLLTVRTDIDFPASVQFAPDLLAKALYLVIPFSFAFAILKYRLMNIDIIIRRTVLYTMLSAVVLFVYVVLVAGVGSLIVHFTAVQSQTMVIASTIVVGLIAVPLRNRLQQMVDRNLFRERRDYPLALRKITHAISSLDPELFPQYATEQVQQALQNRFVLLATRGEAHFNAAAKVGVADEIIESFRVPIADGTSIDRDAPPLRRLGTDLVIPVRMHGHTLGFLALGAKLSDQEFDANDIEFLASAASQIALGVESARMRTDEQDYAQARAMQQLLLPTRFPTVEGFRISGMWQPARIVGGDYFDTIALGDGKVAICIADVAGKGMPAALMMANLQAAVKATAGRDVSPAALNDKVKRVVAGNLAGGTFISFFYGVLDAPSRTFAYSNAGHNAPIVVRANGAIERLTEGGPVFCRLFREATHAAGSITLGPGDRLVLFTDGASEARHAEEEFGEDRLANVIVANRTLSAEELQRKIAETIAEYTRANFEDDMTLVVVSAE